MSCFISMPFEYSFVKGWLMALSSHFGMVTLLFCQIRSRVSVIPKTLTSSHSSSGSSNCRCNECGVLILSSYRGSWLVDWLDYYDAILVGYVCDSLYPSVVRNLLALHNHGDFFKKNTDLPKSNSQHPHHRDADIDHRNSHPAECGLATHGVKWWLYSENERDWVDMEERLSL